MKLKSNLNINEFMTESASYIETLKCKYGFFKNKTKKELLVLQKGVLLNFIELNLQEKTLDSRKIKQW